MNGNANKLRYGIRSEGVIITSVRDSTVSTSTEKLETGSLVVTLSQINVPLEKT